MERSRLKIVLFALMLILSFNIIRTDENPDETFNNYMLQNHHHYFYLFEAELKSDNQGLYIHSNTKVVNSKLASINIEESINLGKYYPYKEQLIELVNQNVDKFGFEDKFSFEMMRDQIIYIYNLLYINFADYQLGYDLLHKRNEPLDYTLYVFNPSKLVQNYIKLKLKTSMKGLFHNEKDESDILKRYSIRNLWTLFYNFNQKVIDTIKESDKFNSEEKEFLFSFIRSEREFGKGIELAVNVISVPNSNVIFANLFEYATKKGHIKENFLYFINPLIDFIRQTLNHDERSDLEYIFPNERQCEVFLRKLPPNNIVMKLYEIDATNSENIYAGLGFVDNDKKLVISYISYLLNMDNLGSFKERLCSNKNCGDIDFSKPSEDLTKNETVHNYRLNSQILSQEFLSLLRLESIKESKIKNQEMFKNSLKNGLKFDFETEINSLLKYSKTVEQALLDTDYEKALFEIHKVRALVNSARRLKNNKNSIKIPKKFIKIYYLLLLGLGKLRNLINQQTLCRNEIESNLKNSIKIIKNNYLNE